MPDYTAYTFDDFVLDERFRRWVLTDTQSDQEFWTNWLQANPDKVDVVLAARQFVSQMHQAQDELSEETLTSEVNRIRLNRQLAQDQEELRPTPPAFTNWFRVAAAILLVGLGSWLFFKKRFAETPLQVHQQLAEQQAGPLQNVRNTTNASQLVHLPDGSRVTLYRSSQISYPRNFTGKQREVFLVGEAFFDVVRRPKQPFLVYTNQVTTKVLGTSFTVRAYADDKEANVVVRTGKVSVYSTPTLEKTGESLPNEPAFILTPNQQVTFRPQDHRMERTLVAIPEPVSTALSQPLVFDHTPVVSVFKKLEATYGVVINYDADLLANCELSAEFGTESMYEKLDLICRATDSRYEVIDAQIVIYSKGCRPSN